MAVDCRESWQYPGLLGDVQYKPFGLIVQFSEWHEAGPTDEWLILAIDGVFETLTAEEICDITTATSAAQQPTPSFEAVIHHVHFEIQSGISLARLRPATIENIDPKAYAALRHCMQASTTP